MNTAKTVSIDNAIRFISQYRDMETKVEGYAEKIITACVPDHVTGHLISSWKGRKQNFGDFFLNLGHETQGKFIQHFGIDIPGYEVYASTMRDKPIAALFIEPPLTIKWLHELLKYFYNHGIQEDSSGIKLKHIPKNKEECYGNSSNWGKYILSLEEDDQVALLIQIKNFCGGDIMFP